MKTVLVDGITNQQGAIMPKPGQISYVGKVITVPVTTPNNLPLVIDTTTLPVPFRNGAADTKGMGFQVFEYNTGASDMDEIAISSVSAASQTVTITLSAAPAKAHVRLVYAFEGQRYAGAPVAGCAYTATTCVVNGTSRMVFPWQGNLHGNIRTATDFTDLHGEAIQYWMPTFNESVTDLSLGGPATCRQGQTCNYTATGGTAPYTWSLVSGSVGSIDSTTGAYLAPAKVTPKHVIGGCQALPNNSIFNTRIDSLPVHTSSDLWMSNINYGIVSTGAGMRINTVLSTDTTTPMSFFYTPAANGNFIFAPFPDRVSESGGALTAPGWLGGIDNHFLTVYRDTCQLQEAYQLYSTGTIVGEPGVNSQSGLILDMKGNSIPGYGTDAAGLPITPLLTHQSELLDAANGNIDALQHAVRITIDAQSLHSSAAVWPSVPQTGSGFCQGPPVGGNTWQITGNGTTTVTAAIRSGQTHPDDFKLWPAGATVTIDGTPYTVVSVSNPDPDPVWAAVGLYTTLTVSATVSSGAHTMTMPGASCVPYGARLRLKSTFVPRFLSTCNVTCQNVARAIYRAQQRYGLVIADIGNDWNGQGDGGYDSYDIQQGLANAECSVSNCGFDQLIGKAANYEVIDESSLQTNRTQTGPDPNWTEAKLGNGYVTPDSAAVIKVSDNLGAISYYSVSLQGVTVGVEHPNEIVMAGASPFFLHPWVTGSSNTAYTCSISPGGGKYGTVTSGCMYSPPPASAVPAGEVTVATITVTAAADSTATKAIAIQIIPVAADGKMYLSLGKSGTSAAYNDGTRSWINDQVQGLSPALSPDDDSYAFSGTWVDYSGSYVSSSPHIFDRMLKGLNDEHFRIHVPNGSVTGTVIPPILLRPPIT